MKFNNIKILVIIIFLSTSRTSFPLTEQELKKQYDTLEQAIKALNGKAFKRILSKLTADDLRTLQEKTTNDNPTGFSWPSLPSIINEQKKLKQHSCELCYSSCLGVQLMLGLGLLTYGFLEINENNMAIDSIAFYGCYLKNGTFIEPPHEQFDDAISPSNKATIGLPISTALYLTGRHLAQWHLGGQKSFPSKALASINLNLEEALEKIEREEL